jgi:hypothetical protein
VRDFLRGAVPVAQVLAVIFGIVAAIVWPIAIAIKWVIS